MLSLSFKLVFLTIFLCVFQAYGGDDKSGKLLKSADLKSKLLKTETSLPAVDSREGESDTLDNQSISDLGISIPPEYANDTIQIDHHIYYNSTFYADPDVGQRYWIPLTSYPETIIHELLSSSHRQATTVDLKFDFPFYGSILKNVTIATGGFLYTGDYLHNYIAATQYVAPLMANFDTNQSSNSIIKYADNGTAFTIEWNQVYVKDRKNDGAFTFQVTLLKNGDIIFAYKDIPYPVSNISDSSHPVKIGISDAYILERSLFFVRRKTIYEYHRIDMLKKSIGNNTALYFTALPMENGSRRSRNDPSNCTATTWWLVQEASRYQPTCLSYKNCNSCISADPKLECIWCQKLNRCSDGVDRLRQSWIKNECSINVITECPAAIASTTDKSPAVSSSKESLLTSPITIAETSTKYFENPSKSKQSSAYNISVNSNSNNIITQNNPQEAAHYIQEEESSNSSISVGAIITILAFIVALMGATGWIVYAYKFPQTPSGQFLIKYRPSQWALRKEDGSVTSSSRHL